MPSDIPCLPALTLPTTPANITDDGDTSSGNSSHTSCDCGNDVLVDYLQDRVMELDTTNKKLIHENARLKKNVRFLENECAEFGDNQQDYRARWQSRSNRLRQLLSALGAALGTITPADDPPASSSVMESPNSIYQRLCSTLERWSTVEGESQALVGTSHTSE